MITLNAHAKINLSLDVLNKRDDGYHNLKMIMQTLQLHDIITIQEIKSGIEIECDAPYVPSNNSNIAYKAAEILIQKFGLNSGVRIKIEKIIPVAAGLAGGSSDAAAVLKGMNNLFDLGMNQQQLMDIGKTIGADVPYCIVGGTALAEGIGEIITPLPKMDAIPVILIKPRFGVSTASVFKSLQIDKITDIPKTDLLIEALKNKDTNFIGKNLCNVLESVTVERYPLIDKIKRELMSKGSMGSIMSGSGPTVFGLFEDDGIAKKAYDKINKNRVDCILTYITND